MGSTPSRAESTTSSKAGSRPGSGVSSKSSKKGGVNRSSGVQFGVQGVMNHKALSSVAASTQKEPSMHDKKTLCSVAASTPKDPNGKKLKRGKSIHVGKHVSPAVRLWLPSVLRRSQLEGKDYDALLKRILHDELELTWDECKPVLEKITHINQGFMVIRNDGAHAIASVMAAGVLPALKDLNLERNFITDEGAKALADAIARGKVATLENLHFSLSYFRSYDCGCYPVMPPELRHNKIADDYKHEVAEALIQWTSVKGPEEGGRAKEEVVQSWPTFDNDWNE